MSPANTKHLLRNRARCLGCGDTIESTSVHDFVTCTCGALSVDGGLSYTKRVFSDVAWEELSEYSDQAPLQDEHRLENSMVVLHGVHARGTCRGERCTIHKLSRHPMRHLEQQWWVGRMWRVCVHGTRHPDPDEIGFVRFEHECCEQKCCDGAYQAVIAKTRADF